MQVAEARAMVLGLMLAGQPGTARPAGRPGSTRRRRGEGPDRREGRAGHPAVQRLACADQPELVRRWI